MANRGAVFYVNSGSLSGLRTPSIALGLGVPKPRCATLLGAGVL